MGEGRTVKGREEGKERKEKKEEERKGEVDKGRNGGRRKREM